MYRIKFFALLLVVGLVLGTSLDNSYAREISTAPAMSDSNISPDEISQADLEEFVELAFSEKISVAEAHDFYERLTGEQREAVSDLVAIKAGIPLEEWRQERSSHQNELNSPSSNFSLEQPSSPSGEIWRQPIENAWTVGYPPGSTFASFYYTSTTCEGDNPDPDTDYVFYFPMSYSKNPDGLRWTSDSAQVYLAFMAAYGGNLNGYAYSWSEVRLCIGSGGVSAAGGANNVKNNVFVHP